MSAIFLSHSSKDNAVASALMADLERQGHRSVFLDFDPENGIPAGREWEKELYQRLRECRGFIVLCSESSMSSRWCFAEITHAKSLGKHVFPIRIAQCKIDPVLTSHQIIDFVQDRDDALQRLWRGLKLAGLDPMDAFDDWDGSRPPYLGLQSFQEEDAAVFFGREPEIQRGLEELRRMRRFGGAKMLMVLGASGSGKSSLVRAGLVPRLRRVEQEWIVVGPFRPREDPLRELSIALADAFARYDEQRDWKAIWNLLAKATAAERSRGEPLRKLVLEIQVAAGERGATVLFVIDQAEELFSGGRAQGAARFVAMLRTALEIPHGDVMAVCTLRSDFLGDFQQCEAARDLAFVDLHVGSMTVDRMTQVIEGPARLSGIELGPGLVQTMITDAETSDALPLLSFTLRELYEKFGDDKLLEVGEYRNGIGGLDGAVAKAASSALAAGPVSTTQETDLKRAFVAMARVNDDGQFVRRPAKWVDLPNHIHDILKRFVRARLLISRDDELEVAHEALFRSWDRLARWLDEDREFLLWRKRLRVAREARRRTKQLLTGPELDEARGWLERRGGQLGTSDHEFISTSVEAAVRRRRRAVALLLAVAFLLCSAAIVSSTLYVSESATRALAQERLQESFGAQARLTVDQPGRMIEGLALAAHAVGPSVAEGREPPTAARAGFFAATSALPDSILAFQGNVRFLRFSPSGDRVLVVGATRADVWSSVTGALVGTVDESWERFAVASSYGVPGPRVLRAGLKTDDPVAVEVLDVETGAVMSSWTENDVLRRNMRPRVGLIREGELALVVTSTGVVLRDVKDGSIVLETASGTWSSVSPNSDATRLALITTGKVVVYDVDSETEIASLSIEGARRLFWTGDNLLVVGNAKATVWNLGADKTTELSESASLTGLRASDDGRRILARNNDGRFHVWDTTTGDTVAGFGSESHISSPLAGLDSRRADLSPCGFRVLWIDDGVATVQTVGGGGLRLPLAEHAHQGVFDPTGQRVAIACKGNTLDGELVKVISLPNNLIQLENTASGLWSGFRVDEAGDHLFGQRVHDMFEDVPHESPVAAASWDIASGKQRWHVSAAEILDANDHRLIVRRSEGAIESIDPANLDQDPLVLIADPGNSRVTARMCNDGSRVAILHQGVLTTWSVDERRVLDSTEVLGADHSSLTIDPKGAVVAITRQDGLVFWNVDSLVGQVLGPLDCRLLAMSDCSTKALVASGQRASIIKVTSGVEQSRFNGHEDAVAAGVFSAGGDLVATVAGDDKRIQVWNSESGELQTSLDSRGVYSILKEFGEKGDVIFTDGTEDRVWDVASGAVLYSLDYGDLLSVEDGVMLKLRRDVTRSTSNPDERSYFVERTRVPGLRSRLQTVCKLLRNHPAWEDVRMYSLTP